MATVDMNYVHFYELPSSTTSFRRKQAGSQYGSQAPHCSISLQRTAAPRDPAPGGIAGGRGIVTACSFKDCSIWSVKSAAGNKSDLSLILDGGAVDEVAFPTLEELLNPHLCRTPISDAHSPQHSTILGFGGLAVDSSGSYIDQTRSGFSDEIDYSKDAPLIIEDDEPDDSPDDEPDIAKDDTNAVFRDLGVDSANQEPDGHTSLQARDAASDLNALDRWYDMEGDDSLEEALQQALERPEQPVPTCGPSHCHSLNEPVQRLVDEEPGRVGVNYSRSKGLHSGSPFHEPDEDKEGSEEGSERYLHDRQLPEGNSEAMVENNVSDDGQQEQSKLVGRKRDYKEEAETDNRNRYSSRSDCSHFISEDDDEDPRPAKRRKAQGCIDTVLTTTFQRNSKSPLRRRLDRLTPPLAMQDETRAAPSLIDEAPCLTPSTSYILSASDESVPAAEYEEWPLQGFLKRTQIGDETIFNVEFSLRNLSEHLKLSVPPHPLSHNSGMGTSVTRKPIAHSKIRSPQIRPKGKYSNGQHRTRQS